MENNALNRRSFFLLSASAFALSACSDIIGPPAASNIYVLKPPLAGAVNGARVAWSLAVEVPQAPHDLDTDRLVISRTADTADYYANAVWQDRLPSIVQNALVDAFEASGRIGQVVRASEGVVSDYILKVDIDDFMARYDAPDGAPTAVVALEAMLVERTGRTLVAHVNVKKEAPAGQNSIAAAVQAEDSALGAALNDIVRWALDAIPSAAEAAAPEPAKRHNRSHHRRT
jgi:cholesterol transport system auxiliary component